jgi:hypothetical protein
LHHTNQDLFVVSLFWGILYVQIFFFTQSVSSLQTSNLNLEQSIKKKVTCSDEENMKLADFRLLICAVVFLFLNIIMLVIYAQIVLKQPNVDEPIDVIFVARGRKRAAIQHKLWTKQWEPLVKTRFIVLHMYGINDDDDTNPGLIHIHTPYTNERDMFIHVASIIPQTNERSPCFLWVSDQVVPLTNIHSDIFRRNQLGYRFFSGFQPDAILFGIQELFELTIPVALMSYAKMTYQTYQQFEVHFISGKHNVFSNMSQLVLFPNFENKIKSHMDNEMFQVVHITPSSSEIEQTQCNDTIKEQWSNYL